MNEEKFLSKNAFDGIIASLEALRTEMQNLVSSVDDLNDPGVIADIQELADNLAQLTTIASDLPSILSVEEALPAINAVNGALTAIQSVSDTLADVTTVAGIEGQVTAVAGIESDVVDVAGSIVAVQDVAANIQAVIDAVQAALDAAQARDDAQTWAEGTDEAVGLIGGEKSSRGWANQAKISSDTAAAYANFEGRWEDATGSYSPPAAFLHNNLLWGLVEDVSDITQSEPSTANPDWILLSSREITGIGATEQIDALDFTIGGGESVYDTGYTTDILLFLNGAQLAASNYDKSGTILTIHHELQPNDEVVILRFDALEIQYLPEKPISSSDKLMLEDVSGEKFSSGFAEMIFQRQKMLYTKDFMPFECRETVSGSASIQQFNSGFNYFKQIQTGETAGSTATLQNPLRHGLFRLPEVNGRQKINFNNRIQFIQHIGLNGWADGCEYTFSFGRTFDVNNDSGEHMFGFTIKGVEPMLYLTANNGSAVVAEVQADVVPEGTGFYLSTICMDFYPGEAVALTLNGVEYEITSQLPAGNRQHTIPGVWTVTNGTSTEDARFEIYRNEVTVIP